MVESAWVSLLIFIWGGLLNEISILLFLVILVVTLRSQSRQKAGVRS